MPAKRKRKGTKKPAAVKQAPTVENVTEKVVTEQIPTDQIVTDQAPTVQTPTDQIVTDQAPTEQTLTVQTPTDQIVTDQAPTEQTPTEQIVTDQAPTEQIPTEQTVTEQIATEQIITEKTVTEEPVKKETVTIPPVVKTVTPLSIDLVRFETTLPYEQVIARLENEINKAGSDDIMSHLRRTNTQDEFSNVIKKFKPGEFLYFSEYPHQRLLQFKDGIKKPACHVYIFGNPLLAQSILTYNPLAGYSIPPRFLITEKAVGAGSIVSYHLPSAIMSMVDGENDPVLQAELTFLDGKIEQLATRITAVQTANL